MAKKIGDIRKEYNQQIEERRRLIELNEEELSGLSKIFNVNKKLTNLQEKYRHELQSRIDMMGAYQRAQEQARKKGQNLHKKTHEAFNKELSLQDKKIKKLEKYNQGLQASFNILKKTATLDFPVMEYLLDFDKSVRETALNLGLSAQNAAQLRTNFEGAHQLSVRLGASSADLAQVQQSYADETGRAKMLSGALLEDIIRISQGTGMGTQQAGNLAGKFELIGYNAEASMNYIQNVVDMSERVGVNVGNVIENINTNFKRLQTYNFKHGVDGMSKMAIYSEKYKMDMTSVLDSMEKARGLEEVIGMAADLQVLGGQFASMADPMAMLFESRNAPEEYTKRINEMTKGMVALQKTSEGYSFELASPMARDMLTKAADALGMSTEELTKQAFRQKELMEMRKEMLGMNLSSDQKKLIEKVAQFDTKTGKFTVTIGNEVHALTDMTKSQIQSLKTEQESLDKRAKNAQTFEDAYQATINELKTVLLPILRGINTAMTTFRPYIQKITDFLNETPEWVSNFLVGVGALGVTGNIFKKSLTGIASFYKSLIPGGQQRPMVDAYGGAKSRQYTPRKAGGAMG
ncbi:MAG: hypothetical protein ACOC2W_01685, partial [bacterium]